MDLHDSSLEHISIDWRTGSGQIDFATSQGIVSIELRAVTCLEVPRVQPWGPSISVLEVDLSGGSLKVNMQSGDVIAVEADEIVLP